MTENKDLNEIFKIEEDVFIYENNLLDNDNNVDFYKNIEHDYNSGNVIPISLTEYRNMIYLEYFIRNIQNIQELSEEKYKEYVMLTTKDFISGFKSVENNIINFLDEYGE